MFSLPSKLPLMAFVAVLIAGAVTAQLALPYSQNFDSGTPANDFTFATGANGAVSVAPTVGTGNTSALNLGSTNGGQYTTLAVADDPTQWSSTTGTPAPADYVASATLELAAPAVTSLVVEFDYEIVNISGAGNEHNTNLVLEYSENGTNWINAGGPGTDVNGLIYRVPTGGNFVNESFTITGISGTQASLFVRFRSLVRFPGPNNQVVVDDLFFETPLETSIPASPSTLPNAQESGLAYSFGLSAAGGLGPYTFAADPAAPLPGGIEIADTSGLGDWVLQSSGSGPTQGTYDFNILITDSATPAASLTHGVRLVVTAPPAALLITNASPLPSVAENGSYALVLSAVGGIGPYSWAMDAGAPAYLSINPTSGELSSAMVPLTVGQSVNFGVVVSDSRNPADSTTKSFTLNAVQTITVPGGSTSLPQAGTADTYAFFLTANGGEGSYEFTVNPADLPGGLTLNAATGEIRGAPFNGTGGTYDFDVTISDVNAGGSQSVTVAHSLDVAANAPASLAIDTTTLPDGEEEVAYSTNIEVSGGTPPYFYNAGATLPAGMTLSNTGKLGGTPSVGTAGNRNITITITDNGGSPAVMRTLTVTIDQAILPLVISTSALPDAQVADFYTENLMAAGGVGPYTWSVTDPGDLPPNLTIATSGVVSGMPQVTAIDTPGVSKSYAFEVTVTDSQIPAQMTTANVTLEVDPSTSGDLQILTNTLPDGRENEAYGDFQLSSFGGSPIKTWSLGTGSILPNGLTLSTAGVLSGTPESNTEASYSVTIVVMDNAGDEDTVTLNLEVQPEDNSGNGGGGNPPADLGGGGGGGCAMTPATMSNDGLFSAILMLSLLTLIGYAYLRRRRLEECLSVRVDQHAERG